MPKNVLTLSLPVELAKVSQDTSETRTPAAEAQLATPKRNDRKGKRKRTKHPPHVTRRFNPSSRFRG